MNKTKIPDRVIKRFGTAPMSIREYMLAIRDHLDEFLDGAETQYKKELESFFDNLGYSFEKIAVIYIELFVDKKEKKYYIDNELMSEELAYIFVLYTNMNVLKTTDEIKLIEK